MWMASTETYSLPPLGEVLPWRKIFGLPTVASRLRITRPLTAPFSEEEVWAAIKGMNPSSAPGPDGLPVKFFQTFWEVIKPEVMALFDEFLVGSIDLARLNFGVITLIPKVAGASEIRQFRPITVINVIFRILAKGYAIRVAPIADRITDPD